MSRPKPAGAVSSREEREKFLKPYLPQPRKRSQSARASESLQSNHPRHVRSKALLSHSPIQIVTLLLHKLLFHLIQFVFSVYIRLRQTYHALHDRTFSILYYHHRTPELIQKDVKSLGKVPKHLSVIVDLRADYEHKEAVQRFMSDVAELAAWSACAGIEMLSVYERTGVLKSHIPELYRTTTHTFSSYFPRPQRPSLHVRAPNKPSYSPSTSPSRPSSPSLHERTEGPNEINQLQHLNLLLISSQDGRDTLVDLTKTLAEMCQKRKIASADVTMDLIHAEIEDATACKEPDLLVVMAGSAELDPRKKRLSRHRGKTAAAIEVPASGVALPTNSWSGDAICLKGYPPWQVRLTEIFHVQDSSGIGYQVFLRALHRYAKAEMRFGR